MKKIVLYTTLLLLIHTNLFAYLTQGSWRWRNNDGTEKTATWKAGQDTAIRIIDNKAIRLRIDVYNTQSTAKGYNGGLEYATTLNGPWTTLTSDPGKNPFVFGGNNAYIDDNDTTSAQLTETVSYIFAAGKVITMSGDLTDSLLAGQRKEFEWCIKPTQYTAPNTTYYFRTQTGANEINNLPSVITSGNFSPPPALLSNGSFEQGLAGWTDQDNNGGNNFALEDTAVFEGNSALQVTVTNPGTAGSLQTAHTPIHFDPTRVYLLRFWAKANVNAAELQLYVGNGNSGDTISYKMYTQWQRYQFAFKPGDTTMAVQFFYQTNGQYTLDDVTLVDDTDPVSDVDMTYMWQNNRPGYGWLTADGQESIKLPDSRIAWFFSDTWLGYNDTTNNFTNTDELVNNDLVAQTGTPPNGLLNTYFTGTSASPLALMLPVTPVGVQSWYWPRDQIIENDTLKILLPEVERTIPNAYPSYANIESIASISLPDLKVVKIENIPYLGDDQYSVLLHEDTGKYNYAYGSRTVDSITFSTVARYPIDQLSAAVPWQFLSDTSWVSDNTKATSISPNTFSSIIKLGPGNYAAIYEPDVSNQIYVMYSPTPYGPWANSTLIYQIPFLANGITYFPYLHKETVNNGVYTISYSSNTTIPQMLNDKGTYQPHFVKANLMAYSPYSTIKSADSLLSLSARDTSQQVQLNWVSAQNTDAHYDVQRSTDGKIWQVIATVEGTDSTSLAHYHYLDVSPVVGLNFYRIALYDEDSKLTLSNIVTVNTYETANLTSFTAVADGVKVKIDWSTSSELNNPLFTVQKSTDDKTWSTLTTVAGGGTTTAQQNYETFEDDPIDGINYYRLQYLYNSRDTLSAVATVNMLQKLIFNIYPNPTSSYIQFALKGYQGISFTAKLYDETGKLADDETFNINDTGLYSLTVNPAAGVYVLVIKGTGIDKNGKVVVE